MQLAPLPFSCSTAELLSAGRTVTSSVTEISQGTCFPHSTVCHRGHGGNRKHTEFKCILWTRGHVINMRADKSCVLKYVLEKSNEAKE